MKIFGREPALWVSVIAAALSLGVTFGWTGLDDGKATAIVATVSAGAGVLTAMATRPWSVSLFTGLISAAAVLAAGYGLHFTQEQVGMVQLLAATVLTLIARGHITPNIDPRPLYPAAPTRVGMRQ